MKEQAPPLCFISDRGRPASRLHQLKSTVLAHKLCRHSNARQHKRLVRPRRAVAQRNGFFNFKRKRKPVKRRKTTTHGNGHDGRQPEGLWLTAPSKYPRSVSPSSSIPMAPSPLPRICNSSLGWTRCPKLSRQRLSESTTSARKGQSRYVTSTTRRKRGLRKRPTLSTTRRGSSRLGWGSREGTQWLSRRQRRAPRRQVRARTAFPERAEETERRTSRTPQCVVNIEPC